MKSVRMQLNEEARERKLRKEYMHRKWISRQQAYHKMIERDCYGVKAIINGEV